MLKVNNFSLFCFYFLIYAYQKSFELVYVSTYLSMIDLNRLGNLSSIIHCISVFFFIPILVIYIKKYDKLSLITNQIVSKGVNLKLSHNFSVLTILLIILYLRL